MQRGLFKIDILVGSQRVFGNLDVQMIGSGDVDCVDIFAVEHLLVFDEDLGLRHVIFEAILEIGDLLVVNVGQRAESRRGDPAQRRRILSVARRPRPMTPRPTRSLAPGMAA